MEGWNFQTRLKGNTTWGLDSYCSQPPGGEFDDIWKCSSILRKDSDRRTFLLPGDQKTAKASKGEQWLRCSSSAVSVPQQ